MSQISRPFVAALAAVIVACSAAVAQQGRSSPQPPAVQQPAAEPPAPYEPHLLRLAEIVGSLAYLRDLCGEKDGDAWRSRMNNLIEAESASQGRKERLAGAYNRGFKVFENTYRACTPNARAVIDLYLTEGGQLAHDIDARYGGG